MSANPGKWTELLVEAVLADSNHDLIRERLDVLVQWLAGVKSPETESIGLEFEARNTPEKQAQQLVLVALDPILFRAGNSPWETLGLRPGAEPEAVKKRYYRLTKIYHPDRQLSAEEWLNERAEKLNLAYEPLKRGKIPPAAVPGVGATASTVAGRPSRITPAVDPIDAAPGFGDWLRASLGEARHFQRNLIIGCGILAALVIALFSLVEDEPYVPHAARQDSLPGPVQAEPREPLAAEPENTGSVALARKPAVEPADEPAPEPVASRGDAAASTAPSALPPPQPSSSDQAATRVAVAASAPPPTVTGAQQETAGLAPPAVAPTPPAAAIDGDLAPAAKPAAKPVAGAQPEKSSPQAPALMPIIQVSELVELPRAVVKPAPPPPDSTKGRADAGATAAASEPASVALAAPPAPAAKPIPTPQRPLPAAKVATPPQPAATVAEKKPVAQAAVAAGRPASAAKISTERAPAVAREQGSSAAAMNSAPTGGADLDRRRVRFVLTDYANRYSKGDAPGMAALYTEAAEQGTLSGRQAIEGYYRRLFSVTETRELYFEIDRVNAAHAPQFEMSLQSLNGCGEPVAEVHRQQPVRAAEGLEAGDMIAVALLIDPH